MCGAYPGAPLFSFSGIGLVGIIDLLLASLRGNKSIIMLYKGTFW